MTVGRGGVGVGGSVSVLGELITSVRLPFSPKLSPWWT